MDRKNWPLSHQDTKYRCTHWCRPDQSSKLAGRMTTCFLYLDFRTPLLQPYVFKPHIYFLCLRVFVAERCLSLKKKAPVSSLFKSQGRGLKISHVVPPCFSEPGTQPRSPLFPAGWRPPAGEDYNCPDKQVHLRDSEASSGCPAPAHSNRRLSKAGETLTTPLHSFYPILLQNLILLQMLQMQGTIFTGEWGVLFWYAAVKPELSYPKIPKCISR